MDYDLVKEIANQIPAGIVVQFHNNGEPLMYPYIGLALNRFKHCIRHFDTNGKLLLEKAEVALVPGSAFGLAGYLRLSFALDMESLEKALTRIRQTIE